MILANHGIVSSSGGLPPSTLLTNLYAVYKAENNANDSLGTYNGTAQGGLTYTTGKIGTAFNFNGSNSYVNFPTDSWNGTINSDFSVSVWVNFADPSDQQSIISNLNSINGGNYGWEIRMVSGQPQFRLYLYYSIEVNSSVYFSPNTWYNVVITRKKGSRMSIYINGVLSYELNYSSDPVFNSTYYPSIGVLKLNNTTFYYYLKNNTKVDAVNIWNKELTATEVTELYNAGAGKFYPY